MTTYHLRGRHWIVAFPQHPHDPHTQEQTVTAVPLHAVQASGEQHKPTSIQRVATLHESAVKSVAESKPKRARKKSERKATEVTHSRTHPAYQMAHALGIARERVQITADTPMWGAIIHNDGSWHDRG